MQRTFPKLIEAGAVATITTVGLALAKRAAGSHSLESAPAVSPFAEVHADVIALLQPDLFREFVSTSEQLLRSLHLYEMHRIGHMQFLSNRFAFKLVSILQTMVSRAKKCRRDDVIDAAVIVETEHIPYVRSVCDNLLNNMLLS